MSGKRVSLYDRLPEIYRIRDAQQTPPYPLKQYLEPVEDAFSAIRDGIEALYNDLFIETASDWVVPYIGDLLGTSRLIGDPWTLRADVADTIALRRRKGTLGAIEKLTFDLTRWRVHAVELRDRLAWSQSLNHLRPDLNPHGNFKNTLGGVQGGTALLRDPALSELCGTPFDPYARTVDVKPLDGASIRYNIPNVAVFLWQLRDYQIQCAKPVLSSSGIVANANSGSAAYLARFFVHPVSHDGLNPPAPRQLRLFNTYQLDEDGDVAQLTPIDRMPNPIPFYRLTEDFPSSPDVGGVYGGAYVGLNTYSKKILPGEDEFKNKVLLKQGFQLHFPDDVFGSAHGNWNDWKIRAADLCNWEKFLSYPLDAHTVLIDPRLGRFIVCAKNQDEADALGADLLMTYTYGAVGPVGAHPVQRQSLPANWTGAGTVLVEVNFDPAKPGALQDILKNINYENPTDLQSAPNSTKPLVIQINDSTTYSLNADPIALNRPVVIRAASQQRPTLLLSQPLAFSPAHLTPNAPDSTPVGELTVRLEGLFLAKDSGFDQNTASQAAGGALISRAAVARLEIAGCTLDPGGSRNCVGTRSAPMRSLFLTGDYGFAKAADREAFGLIPAVWVSRSVLGPVSIDEGYELSLADSILDAGKAVGDPDTSVFALSAASSPQTSWGPDTHVANCTFFGRVRVFRLDGEGGIWCCTLEVSDNQKGCIKESFIYTDDQNPSRIPTNSGCIKGKDPVPHFDNAAFDEPAYGRLSDRCDRPFLEQGPGQLLLDVVEGEFSEEREPSYAVVRKNGRYYKLGDQMGAYGFLLDSYKWKNLKTRFREFMPAGIRAILIPINYNGRAK